MHVKNDMTLKVLTFSCPLEIRRHEFKPEYSSGKNTLNALAIYLTRIIAEDTTLKRESSCVFLPQENRTQGFALLKGIPSAVRICINMPIRSVTTGMRT